MVESRDPDFGRRSPGKVYQAVWKMAKEYEAGPRKEKGQNVTD